MATPQLIPQNPPRKGICREKLTKYHLLQVLVALGGGLSSLGPGMSMGFSAVALPHLRPHSPQPGGSLHSTSTHTVTTNGTEETLNLEATMDSGDFILTNEQAAWFMSVTMATTPLGCLIAGYLNDLIGRKGALLSIVFPGVVGWIMLATVPPPLGPGNAAARVSTAVLSQMILGRALNGITIGMGSSPGSVLACETTSPRLRGAVLCMNSFCLSIGILLVYFLGGVLPGWRMIAVFATILTGLVSLLSLLLPESPVWLRSKGRHGDADWVCIRLGLKTPATEDGSGEARFRSQESPDSIGVLKAILLLLEPKTLRPLLTMAGLFICQQSTGIYVVMFNAVEIAAASGITGSVINSGMTAVLLGMCSTLGLSIICIFIDRLGRRPTAIFSSSVMSVCMAVLAIYNFVVPTNPPLPKTGRHYPFLGHFSNFNHSIQTTDGKNTSFAFGRSVNATDLLESLSASDASTWHSWIPLTALLTWALSAGMGMMPLPWAITPELLPSKTRSLGFGVLSAFAYCCAFVALRVFAALVVPLGLSGCMLIMSIMSVVCAVYVAALVPETKGVPIDGLEERGGRWKEVIHGSVNVVSHLREADEDEVVYG